MELNGLSLILQLDQLLKNHWFFIWCAKVNKIWFLYNKKVNNEPFMKAKIMHKLLITFHTTLLSLQSDYVCRVAPAYRDIPYTKAQSTVRRA